MTPRTLADTADPGLIGTCGACGGQMIESVRAWPEDRISVTLVCQDCGDHGNLVGEPEREWWADPVETRATEVIDVETARIAWVDCPRCHGGGWIEDPLCDLSAAMNGRDTACPRCHTSGSVPRIVEVDDVE